MYVFAVIDPLHIAGTVLLVCYCIFNSDVATYLLVRLQVSDCYSTVIGYFTYIDHLPRQAEFFSQSQHCRAERACIFEQRPYCFIQSQSCIPTKGYKRTTA